MSISDSDNPQGTKLDHFNIERIEHIDKDVFTALTYLGFHLEQKLNKYMQMLSEVYCFLARALILLTDQKS